MPKTGCKHINAQRSSEQHLLGIKYMEMARHSCRPNNSKLEGFAQILMVAKHLFFSSIQTLSCNVKTYLTFFVFKDNFYNCEKRPLLKSVGNFTEVSGIISDQLMRKIWCFDSRLSEKNRFFRCLQGKEMQVENCDNLSNIYSDSTEFVN